MIKTRLLISLFCLFFILNNTKSASNPTRLALSCGNKDGGKDNDGQAWESDSKYLLNTKKTVESSAETQDPSLPSKIPYMKARFFNTETTYKFPINGTSRYFLRFHFYPSAYPNFNSSNSYFTVLAGKTTLLKNFSASISTQALTQSYIVREYSLAPSDTDSLSITFKPDKGFAFVNGIELVPSPPDLFGSASMVGFEDQPLDTSSADMQMMWRLNVGGNYIPPSNDSSALGRSWYDDSPYVYSAAAGITSEAEKNVTIEYRSSLASVAPLDVYRTSRQMGLDGNVTRKYNLTWAFQVDANFTYLVRMHFCEYQLEKINDRVFDIFINNRTAMKDADVIAWSGGMGIPYYKDFAIYVPNRPGDETLWVAMCPDNTMRPSYFDAILNGLEIFKIRDSKSNLAGANPCLSDIMQKQLQEQVKRN